MEEFEDASKKYFYLTPESMRSPISSRYHGVGSLFNVSARLHFIRDITEAVENVLSKGLKITVNNLADKESYWAF